MIYFYKFLSNFYNINIIFVDTFVVKIYKLII